MEHFNRILASEKNNRQNTSEFVSPIQSRKSLSEKRINKLKDDSEDEFIASLGELENDMETYFKEMKLKIQVTEIKDHNKTKNNKKIHKKINK